MLEEEDKLIKKAQKGEAESFGILYDHYSSPIYRFIFLKVNNKSLAEDLFHEVFLSAWQNINNYSHKGFPFSSWLYQIARNRVIDYYRTKKDFTEISDEEDRFITLTAENVIDHSLNMEKIKGALDQLSEEQSNVIILRFINDLSPAEIALVLNKSEGAVRLMQHIAIANLKKILNKKL